MGIHVLLPLTSRLPTIDVPIFASSAVLMSSGEAYRRNSSFNAR
jgi:hypothetical protein